RRLPPLGHRPRHAAERRTEVDAEADPNPEMARRIHHRVAGDPLSVAALEDRDQARGCPFPAQLIRDVTQGRLDLLDRRRVSAVAGRGILDEGHRSIPGPNEPLGASLSPFLSSSNSQRHARMIATAAYRVLTSGLSLLRGGAIPRTAQKYIP